MFRYILVILLASFVVESVFSQSTLVAKTIDTTHQSVVAVFGVEKSGKPWICGSGVLIHPQVILTAGHVNFRIANMSKEGGCLPKGFVSFGNSVNSSKVRIGFDWIKDVESHPDTANFWHSFSDTTGVTKPSMFIDLGLIFLEKPIYSQPLALLPLTTTLAERTPGELFVGVGYGYYKTVDSTYKDELMDGQRRQWSFKNITEINDLWISTDCDSLTKLPFASIHDSGAPIFLGNNLVIGILSREDKAPKPCAYSSCAVRIDNPKVLVWIKESIKKRLGINIY
jgi:hypothetical protein